MTVDQPLCIYWIKVVWIIAGLTRDWTNDWELENCTYSELQRLKLRYKFEADIIG